MAKIPKITVPYVDGKRLPVIEAALLCALSEFRRIWTYRQEQALLWCTQRYLAAWLGARRFFDGERTHYQAQVLLQARAFLLREGLLSKLEVPGGCEYWLNELGHALAMKFKAAMPQAMGAESFANARAQRRFERRLKKGHLAA